jgi:hypothetical protein
MLHNGGVPGKRGWPVAHYVTTGPGEKRKSLSKHHNNPFTRKKEEKTGVPVSCCLIYSRPFS